MNRYLADTIFRAYGSAKRVKIFKITRRRVPGMVVYMETLKKEFHCTAQQVQAEATVERLNGFREPRIEYHWTNEDLLNDIKSSGER